MSPSSCWASTDSPTWMCASVSRVVVRSRRHMVCLCVCISGGGEMCQQRQLGGCLTGSSRIEPRLDVSFSCPTTHDVHNSSLTAVRQAIAKALVAFYQKYVDEAAKREIKNTLMEYDRTLLVADPRRPEPKKYVCFVVTLFDCTYSAGCLIIIIISSSVMGMPSSPLFHHRTGLVVQVLALVTKSRTVETSVWWWFYLCNFSSLCSLSLASPRETHDSCCSSVDQPSLVTHSQHFSFCTMHTTIRTHPDLDQSPLDDLDEYSVK